MKKLFIAAIAGSGIFFALALWGLYPAAVVDGTIVTHRTWRELEEASKRFANLERARLGEPPINYGSAEDSAILLEGRKAMLGALIEERIIAGEGLRILPDFDARSEQKISEAARRAPNLKKGVERLYGISYEDFKSIVLLPQARIEVLKEALDEREVNFEERLKEIKRQASVRLYFTGFSWDGERVK